jgi:hypothetical protein
MRNDVLRHIEEAAMHLDHFLNSFPGHLGSAETTLLLASDALCQAMHLARKGGAA